MHDGTAAVVVSGLESVGVACYILVFTFSDGWSPVFLLLDLRELEDALWDELLIKEFTLKVGDNLIEEEDTSGSIELSKVISLSHLFLDFVASFLTHGFGHRVLSTLNDLGSVGEEPHSCLS